MMALPWIGPRALDALPELSKIVAGGGETAELAKATMEQIEQFQDERAQDDGDVWIFSDPLKDAAKRR
jgi:hypothetical protein